MSGRPRCAVVRAFGPSRAARAVLLFARAAPEGPPALCPLFSWYPLACVKGSLPFDRSLWHGPSLRRTGDGPSVASARRAQETRLAAPGSEAPRSAPKRPKAPRVPAPAAAGASPLPPPAPWVRARPAPSPSLPRIYPRIYVPRPGRFGCPAARARSCRSRRAPAPAACAVGAHQPRTAQALRAPAGRKKRASPHPAPKHLKPPRSTPKCHAPPQPARSQPHPAARPAPSPHLRRPFRAYILGYTSLSPTDSDAPPHASAPAAAGASRPLALRRGQEGSAPSPAGKPQPAPTFSAAPTSAQPPFSSRSRSPWHTAPRRWCGCHGRDTAAGRARFGRGRIRSG